MKPIRNSIFSLILFILFIIPSLMIWLIFLFRYGDSTNPSQWPSYLLLSPLTLYLFFFLSYFQRTRGPQIQSLPKSIFRLGCLLVLLLSLMDALGASLNRILHQRLIDRDWRYSIFIHNWLQKKNLEIPPTSGDEVPGPFLSFVHGKSILSDITSDQWGFRREIPDRYSEISPSKTINLLCLGGSVMFGMTTRKGDLSAPDLFQDLLYREMPEIPFRVYNAAFPGAHVGSIAVPAGSAYWQIEPDMIFVYEAINWLAPGQKSFLENRNSLLMTWIRNYQIVQSSTKAADEYIPNEYGKKLEEFLQSCRLANPRTIPVFMTFSLPYSEYQSPRELAYWDRMQNGQGCAYAAAVVVRKHNEKMIEVAHKQGIPILDTQPFLQNCPDFFLDSCHLTQTGNRILAHVMAEYVLHSYAQGYLTPKNE